MSATLKYPDHKVKKSTIETDIASTIENTSYQVRPKSRENFGYKKKISINIKSNSSFDMYNIQKVNVSVNNHPMKTQKVEKHTRCSTADCSKFIPTLNFNRQI